MRLLWRSSAHLELQGDQKFEAIRKKEKDYVVVALADSSESRDDALLIGARATAIELVGRKKAASVVKALDAAATLRKDEAAKRLEADRVYSVITEHIMPREDSVVSEHVPP